MGHHRIVCVRMEKPASPQRDSDILAVGLAGNTQLYPVEQVAGWIESKEHSFYTTNAAGQHPRATEVCPCKQTTRKHIRSVPDQWTDNNLESQPDCK
jgi:hypothetical protein